MRKERGDIRNGEVRTCSHSRRNVLKLLGATGTAGIASLAGCLGGDGGGDGGNGGNGDQDQTTTTGSGQTELVDEMTVFHAGSLGPPFSKAEKQFEKKYDVSVLREAKGSVASTKKITEQGRKAAVLGVSDYRLIRDRILEEFGNWYAIFATNEMTIAYTDQSAGADEISPDNWWKILTRDDVKFAHADPAIDPNGYRSVMVMQLGMTPFEGKKLYGKETYKTLRERELVPAGTESALIGQLQTGAIDYAFEYSSAGATHDVKTIDLQPSVDLSKATAKYAKHYAKAKVNTKSGTFTGAPIAYGITIPNVAEAPKLGVRWVEFMTTKPGQQILKKTGFTPTEPAVVPKSTTDAVPQRVLKNAKAKDSLGPLEL
jgi:molybdate/tungstate transport system substrate-binding protein